MSSPSCKAGANFKTMTETREAHEIVQSIHTKANSRKLSKASYHDIDHMIQAPKGTCRVILDTKRKKSIYLARLIEIEQLFINQ